LSDNQEIGYGISCYFFDLSYSFSFMNERKNESSDVPQSPMQGVDMAEMEKKAEPFREEIEATSQSYQTMQVLGEQEKKLRLRNTPKSTELADKIRNNIYQLDQRVSETVGAVEKHWEGEESVIYDVVSNFVDLLPKIAEGRAISVEELVPKNIPFGSKIHEKIIEEIKDMLNAQETGYNRPRMGGELGPAHMFTTDIERVVFEELFSPDNNKKHFVRKLDSAQWSHYLEFKKRKEEEHNKS
jgi:hypothetical protein